jgi:hypothetical protein
MASPHVAGAMAVLASRKHNGNVQTLYNTLVRNGNLLFDDTPGDPYKEPLLDLRRIPDAHMIGTC